MIKEEPNNILYLSSYFNKSSKLYNGHYVVIKTYQVILTNQLIWTILLSKIIKIYYNSFLQTTLILGQPWNMIYIYMDTNSCEWFKITKWIWAKKWWEHHKPKTTWKRKERLKLVTSKHEETMTESKKINDGRWRWRTNEEQARRSSKNNNGALGFKWAEGRREPAYKPDL